MNLKELLEKRSTLAVRIKELADKANANGGKFDAADEEAWRSVNADYDALTRQIEILQRAEHVAGQQQRSTREDGAKPGRENVDTRSSVMDDDGDDEDPDALTEEELRDTRPQADPAVMNLALNGWFRRQMGFGIEQRHRKAARVAGIDLEARNLDLKFSGRPMTLGEARALSSVTATSGASTIAPAFMAAFEKAMLFFGGVRETAQVIRTATGAAMPWPTANDTGNEGSIVGENTAPSDVDPVTNSVSWGAYKYTSGMVKIPAELLEDTAFDLSSEVGAMIGERIARIQNRHFTVGTGTGQPRGIVTAATAGPTAGSATAIAANDILNLIHSVDPAYRSNGRLMLHDSILLLVRRLQDTTGRYLFQDATASAPPTIFGVPYTINNHMVTAPVATARTVIFGDLSKYKVRDVNVIRIRRLVERFADADQEGFVAFMRSDGNLLNAGVPPVRALVH